MKRQNILIFLLLLSVFITTSCMKTEIKSNPDSLNEGELAPNFSLQDMDGNMVTLEQFLGEKVYVQFWASWCSVCLAGLKDTDHLSKEATDFTVITIVSPNYKGEMKRDDFIDWFNSLEYENIIVLFDENGLWSNEFNVLAYPTSYFIGTDGVLTSSIVGQLENNDIHDKMGKVY